MYATVAGDGKGSGLCGHFWAAVNSATGITEKITTLVPGHKDHYATQNYFGHHVWTPNPLLLILRPHMYTSFLFIFLSTLLEASSF